VNIKEKKQEVFPYLMAVPNLPARNPILPARNPNPNPNPKIKRKRTIPRQNPVKAKHPRL
jgi:hypothetical protein